MTPKDKDQTKATDFDKHLEERLRARPELREELTKAEARLDLQLQQSILVKEFLKMIDELPTGPFDSTPYKNKLLAKWKTKLEGEQNG
jgi:hypothetical protein